MGLLSVFLLAGFQVRYKADCKEFYGKILGNWNVVSSVQGASSEQTEALWSIMYPNEPYELDPSNHVFEDDGKYVLPAQNSTEYDLVSAVKRQMPFSFQVMKKNLEFSLHISFNLL